MIERPTFVRTDHSEIAQAGSVLRFIATAVSAEDVATAGSCRFHVVVGTLAGRFEQAAAVCERAKKESHSARLWCQRQPWKFVAFGDNEACDILKVEHIAEQAMEHLSVYAWPGNVRQLNNEVRRMVALADSDSTLKPSSLSKDILRATPLPVRGHGSPELAVPLTDKLQAALSRVEREMIKAALKTSDGRVDAAARALGISRKGLYLKRQRLGL